MSHPTTKVGSRSARHRVLARFLTLLAIPALLVIVPNVAQAAPSVPQSAHSVRPPALDQVGTPTLQSVPCRPDLTELQWDHSYFDLTTNEWVFDYYQFFELDVNETFDVSDTRLVSNRRSEVPLNATFASQKSKTWTIAVNTQAQQKFGNFLMVTLGVTFTWSQTTQIGVMANTVVAPHSAVLAEYGTKAFDVSTVDRQVQMRQDFDDIGGQPSCFEGWTSSIRNVPTVQEGWRVSDV